MRTHIITTLWSKECNVTLLYKLASPITKQSGMGNIVIVALLKELVEVASDNRLISFPTSTFSMKSITPILKNWLKKNKSKPDSLPTHQLISAVFQHLYSISKHYFWHHVHTHDDSYYLIQKLGRLPMLFRALKINQKLHQPVFQ